MNLVELQKVFGERIEITLREDLTPEQRQIENEQSRIIMDIGKQMINNGDLILRTEKLMSETRALDNSVIKNLIKG